MKKIAFLALCSLFIISAAEARTLYVNAKRPNNKGNGYKASSAKKTIQAAINIARKGDTILVYPGTYAPIKSNNKKITIKSVKGKGRTKIAPKKSTKEPFTLAMLGKPYKNYGYLGAVYTVIGIDSSGNNTCLKGFSLNGGGYSRNCYAGITGGVVKSCEIRYVQSDGNSTSIVRGSKLVDCILRENDYGGAYGCFSEASQFSRCKILRNGGSCSDECDAPFFWLSSLDNCLIADNAISPTFVGYFSNASSRFFEEECRLVNCTIAFNRIFHSSETAEFSAETHFLNCIMYGNTSQRVWQYAWDDELRYGPKVVCNYDDGFSNDYEKTNTSNKNPRFVNAEKGDYRLKKGSYAINSGSVKSWLSGSIRTKDLAGRKRIRGKAIDRGCYEY